MIFMKSMVKKGVLLVLFASVMCSSVSYGTNQPKVGKYGTYLDANGVWNETEQQKDARMTWWREARFGMFIHWGIYAVPAGEWKGQQDKGLGEWIQLHFKIPVKEYEKLAEQFNPVKYNAEEWVKYAKDAGMKYIVITSKHHDGFAMYHSKASKYNIVDATPFGRDVIAELAQACKKHGIRLGFYYSQSQDWHEPDAFMNYWDFPDNLDKSHEKHQKTEKRKRRSWIRTTFPNYMKRKGLPQVREILTQYGPICLIWYDTPRTITKEQSTEFVNQVRRLQPDCLINSRVGHGLGDYGSTGDNRIPGSRRIGDWETPATMNRTWGYKHNDTDWKSTEQIIHNLVNIVSKGGNYLLNVGPTAEGIIPEPSIKIMREVGCWMDKNSESIYGTVANPLGKLPWGRCTAKTGKVYLHVFDWPQDGKLEVVGLTNKLKKAYLLAGKTKLSATQDGDKIVVNLPKECPDSIDTVVILAIDGDAQISETEQVGNTNILRAGKYTMSVKPDTKVKTSAINLKVIRLLPMQK